MLMFLNSVKLIGKEHKVSSKGNHYDAILVSKGLDTMTFMLPNDVPFEYIKEDCIYDLTLDYRRYGDRSSFVLKQITEVNEKVK